MKLQFEKELWALSPELAVMEMILNQHPELYEMLKDDITLGQASSSFGRQDIPTVEQIMRAAIYKEIKSLTYRELEYAQHEIKGSLQNIIRSKNMETCLKKWRSGIEAVISNLKRAMNCFGVNGKRGYALMQRCNGT